jgi:hypothetical protein
VDSNPWWIAEDDVEAAGVGDIRESADEGKRECSTGSDAACLAFSLSDSCAQDYKPRGERVARVGPLAEEVTCSCLAQDFATFVAQACKASRVCDECVCALERIECTRK